MRCQRPHFLWRPLMLGQRNKHLQNYDTSSSRASQVVILYIVLLLSPIQMHDPTPVDSPLGNQPNICN